MVSPAQFEVDETYVGGPEGGKRGGMPRPRPSLRQHQQIDYYLDEFTFRFNRRRSQARGLLFHRLAQQAVTVAPAPYHTIIGAARADKAG